MFTSNWRPLRRALSTLLLGTAVLLAMPRSACAQLFVANFNSNTVGEYDANTGAINPNFSIMGLSQPRGLALSDDNLYVANNHSNTVGVYDATTGRAMNASLITGLDGPTSLAISANNLLYVANGNNTVGVYDAGTGHTINASLIKEGLSAPVGLAISGADLFVANSGPPHTVGEYDATTGNLIKAITGLSPQGLAISGTDLFVANSGNAVDVYNTMTGATASLITTGLDNPTSLAISGNNLYVLNDGPSPTVRKYNATTGVINTEFFTGPLNQDPQGLAVIPEPSTWSLIAVGGVALLGIMHRKKHRTV